MGNLTAKSVQSAKPGRHADGEGLYLLVKPTGARSWVLRVQVDGQRRDIGLGSVETGSLLLRSDIGDDIPLEEKSRLTLAEARELSKRLRNAAKAGRDPAAERRKDRKPPPTFKEAAIATHAAQSHGWAQRTADAFLASLETHVYPTLGKRRVDTIEAEDIAAALKAIWTTKPDMAKKVRQRVAAVLDYSAAKKWRSTEAPRASVRALTGKAKAGGNFPSMPYADVPDFYAKLGEGQETLGRLGLMLMIATGARTIEVREARWRHIDLDRKEWTRPAELMRKTNLEHMVTLNDAALAVLAKARALYPPKDADALVLPNRKGGLISDMTMSKVMRDAALPWVPHGFRSSLRTWAAECQPQIPEAVGEAALAHVIPDAVVKAYNRATFVQLRRELLGYWSDYITGKESNVVRLADRRA